MALTKVLVAEDFEDSKTGMIVALEKTNIASIIPTSFCIDALNQLKKALLENQPFELLITDLSFTPAFGKNEILTGQELIEKAREVQPSLKIIVFTSNDKQSVIEPLIGNLKIDGYVCKGLNGLKELLNAIEQVSQDKTYNCPVTTAILKQHSTLQLGDYERKLLKLLAKGVMQREIPEVLKKQNISPNGIRSVEDRISKLKDHFNVSTTTQLIYEVTKLDLL